MEPLTKEDFQQALTEHTTRIERKIEASRRDVIHRLEGVESSLAQTIAVGFEDLETRVDVRPRADRLEDKVSQVESALDIPL